MSPPHNLRIADFEGFCWSFALGRSRAHLGGEVTVPGHHPRRWNQHALASIGAVDSGLGAECAVEAHGFQSIAFPLIGAGSGGFAQDQAKAIMLDELQNRESPLEVTVVVFRKTR